MTEAETARLARCACDAVRIEVTGDPHLVSACNCTECQRRTGSVFGVAAYFPKSQIAAKTGATKVFKRGSDSGRSLSMNFCPTCGTTLYWELEMLPDSIGVAVGCFADPSFPAPERAVWCDSKSEWVEFPDSLPVFDRSAT